MKEQILANFQIYISVPLNIDLYFSHDCETADMKFPSCATINVIVHSSGWRK